MEKINKKSGKPDSFPFPVFRRNHYGQTTRSLQTPGLKACSYYATMATVCSPASHINYAFYPILKKPMTQERLSHPILKNQYDTEKIITKKEQNKYWSSKKKCVCLWKTYFESLMLMLLSFLLLWCITLKLLFPIQFLLCPRKREL